MAAARAQSAGIPPLAHWQCSITSLRRISYDRPYFVAWLRSLLLALGIPSAHVVGLSQGGAIALQLAHDHPEMVERLILVDSGALGPKAPLLPLLGMLWLNSFPSRLANRFFSRYLLFRPENRDANHGLYSIEVLKCKGGSNAFTQRRGAAVSAMSENSPRSITHETLLIWGEEDRLFPVECGVNAAALMPNAMLYRIKEAGHLPHIDQPTLFNKALLDFLKG